MDGENSRMGFEQQVKLCTQLWFVPSISAAQAYDLPYNFPLYLHHLRVYYELIKWSARIQVGLIAQLVKHSVHRYRTNLGSRIPFRPEFFSGFSFTAAEVVYITPMINHVIISFSALETYDLSNIHLYCQHLRAYYELITWPANPVGLINQLVVHCTRGTAPVSQRSWFQISYKPELFLGFNFTAV